MVYLYLCINLYVCICMGVCVDACICLLVWLFSSNNCLLWNFEFEQRFNILTQNNTTSHLNHRSNHKFNVRFCYIFIMHSQIYFYYNVTVKHGCAFNIMKILWTF